MTSSTVHYSLQDRIATVRIDDGKRNALSPRVLKDIYQALDRAETRAEELCELDPQAHKATKRRVRRALIRKIRVGVPLDLLDAMLMGIRGARPR